MRAVRLATGAMGCRFELVVVGDDAGYLRAAGENALAEIEDAHQRLSRFAPDSIVSRLNRGAGGAPVRVDGEVLGLLSLCGQVRMASGGAYDVTATGPERSVIEIDAERSSARIVEPGGMIDLGGVGKGYAIDLAIAELVDAGVGSAFVHAGGSSVAAFGRDERGEPWRVRLGESDDTLVLDGLALSVSGTEHQGEHIVDPRSGVPAPESAGQFAITGPSAAACDAWSTAAFVLGSAPGTLPVGYRCMSTRSVEVVDAGIA